jgi:hypothetical protein
VRTELTLPIKFVFLYLFTPCLCSGGQLSNFHSFDPRSVVRFVVNKVALGQFFLPLVLRAPTVSVIPLKLRTSTGCFYWKDRGAKRGSVPKTGALSVSGYYLKTKHSHLRIYKLGAVYERRRFSGETCCCAADGQ